MQGWRTSFNQFNSMFKVFRRYHGSSFKENMLTNLGLSTDFYLFTKLIIKINLYIILLTKKKQNRINKKNEKKCVLLKKKLHVTIINEIIKKPFF